MYTSDDNQQMFTAAEMVSLHRQLNTISRNIPNGFIERFVYFTLCMPLSVAGRKTWENEGLISRSPIPQTRF